MTQVGIHHLGDSIVSKTYRTDFTGSEKLFFEKVQDVWSIHINVILALENKYRNFY